LLIFTAKALKAGQVSVRGVPLFHLITPRARGFPLPDARDN
jgi:hypothetical protein